MSERRRYAVVDIGSNAVRLQVGSWLGGQVRTEVFTRVPLALGGGTFGAGAGAGAAAARAISAPLRRRLVHIVAGMRQIVAGLRPCGLRVVATAAVRAAANRAALLAEVQRGCGVRVRVLSGREEAAALGRYAALHFPAAAVLLNADIGGGSTDCALLRGGALAAVETFQLGTARPHGGTEAEKARCTAWLRAQLPAGGGALLSASGGSARALSACCGGLQARQLAQWQRKVRGMTPAQLVQRTPLSPDRAAQVSEALALHRLLLRGAAVQEIHPLPGGLAEALIARQLQRH